jgi:hypothetical protein
MTDKKELKDLVRLIQQREKVAPAAGLLEDLVSCTDDCACTKKANPYQFSALDTGVLQVLNNVCRGCSQGLKLDKEMARVVCVGCRRVVMRFPPVKDPDGFEYKAGTSYHTERCLVCSPGLDKSVIVEKVIFMRKNGKKL